MAPSPRNTHQLVLVKQLYEDARLLAERPDTFSHTKAVILLDLAVETLLNNLVLNLDPDMAVNASKGSQDTDRKTLWGNATTALNKAVGRRLSEFKELANLHALRNLVQHNGTAPAQTEVRRYLAAAQQMLGSTFKDAYDLDFDSFVLWDFVSNGDLRRWLRHHEARLREGDPVTCIAGCVIAYERIVHAVREKTGGHGFGRRVGSRIMSYLSADFYDYLTKEAFTAVVEEFGELQDETGRRLERLESEMVAIGVGIPVMETRRFLQSSLGIYPAEYANGRVEIALGRDIEPERDAERATFMLDYLSRLIRLIDEGYPGALDGIRLELKKQTE